MLDFDLGRLSFWSERQSWTLRSRSAEHQHTRLHANREIQDGNGRLNRIAFYFTVFYKDDYDSVGTQEIALN